MRTRGKLSNFDGRVRILRNRTCEPIPIIVARSRNVIITIIPHLEATATGRCPGSNVTKNGVTEPLHTHGVGCRTSGNNITKEVDDTAVITVVIVIAINQNLVSCGNV